MMKQSFLVAIVVLFSAGCQGQTDHGETQMNRDEETIRRWFDDWMKATKAGDLELARSLIADDAIFLVPGAGQMDKESFAAAATASDPNLEFELDCSIQEIKVIGDHAYLLATISLGMTDKSTQSQSFMKGDSLSILKRHADGWVVIRDANTMVPVETDDG